MLSYAISAVWIGSTQPASAAQTPITAASLQVQAHAANVSMVAPNFIRGGQPDWQALQELKASGVQVDVSLDNEHELVAQERMNAAAAGLKFINIPLNPLHKPSDYDILRFLEIAERKDQEPVYVHCVHGRDRTGAMVAIYREVHDHWSPDAAYQEMLNNGFRPFFTGLSNAGFDVGKQMGMEGHKPSLGFIATHMRGHINRPEQTILPQ
jgi:protein tyrosine/serine phosphatase